jgi:hypothetical protein
MPSSGCFASERIPPSSDPAACQNLLNLRLGNRAIREKFAQGCVNG